MEKINRQPLIAHLSMFMACAFWGLMSPVGKDAMTHGIDSFCMVSFRVLGGAVLFWITSIFAPKERVPLKDVLLFAGAAVFGLVCNHHRTGHNIAYQCQYHDHLDADLCHDTLVCHSA